MTIESLLKVVPPPSSPIEAFPGPWGPYQADIGAVLPQDYKDFVRLYGSGEFMEFLAINVPVCWSPYGRLVAEAHAICDTFTPAVYEKDLPYPMWPVAGGLLPCGKTDFGDYLFWLTRGPPRDWRIVVWGRGLQEFETFDCDLTDFLAGVVTGDIDPKDFPQYLPCDEPFKPTPYFPRTGGIPHSF